jgi:hypothetical protein
MFRYEYGNDAAGSLLKVSITGDVQLVERVAGQADVVTNPQLESGAMNQISQALDPVFQGTVTEDMTITSPNEGRRGSITVCTSGYVGVAREEGPDPLSGYWLVRRNDATEVASLRALANGLVAVDMPQ